MADPSTAFVGAVPANDDRHLGPILFHHYADDLVARLSVTPGMQVLETACGTGIVTRRLIDRLGARGSPVATDLNQAMIAITAGPGCRTTRWSSGKRRIPRARPSPIGLNQVCRISHETVAGFFLNNPPQFTRCPSACTTTRLSGGC